MSLKDALASVGKYDYKNKRAKTKAKKTAPKRPLTAPVKKLGDTNKTVPTIKPTTKTQKKVAAKTGNKSRIEASDLKPKKSPKASPKAPPKSAAKKGPLVSLSRAKATYGKAGINPRTGKPYSQSPGKSGSRPKPAAVKGLKPGEKMSDHPGLKNNNPKDRMPAPSTPKKKENNSPRGGGARNRGGTAAATPSKRNTRGSGVKGRTTPATSRSRLTPAERRAARRGY